jgi:phosphatidylglycerol:prolipoprotein diacylglycerol transferase
LRLLKPSVDFDYWGLPIYNAMAAIGLLAAMLVLLNREKAARLTVEAAEKLHISGIIGCVFALVCANTANWFLFYPDSFRYSLIQRISFSGISFYYGMFGFLGVFALTLRLLGVDQRRWMNEIIPSLLIFHAFGRIGCSLAGCCYGAELPPGTNILGIPLRLFPAREIESLCLFALFFIFAFKIKRYRLQKYLLCYSVLRFFLEFGRGDNRGFFLIHALSPAQVTSIIVWICLCVWFVAYHIGAKSARGGSPQQADDHAF